MHTTHHTPSVGIGFEQASLPAHHQPLLELNQEYMGWAMGEVGKLTGATPEQLVGMSPADYVASMLHKVCGDGPPVGSFYLVWADGHLAGMGGLRRVSAGVAELKRIYVRPNQRGLHLGQAIVQRLLDDAKQFGYQRILLDSGPFMQSAHRLYETFGFNYRGPYPEAEVPAALYPIWKFMERSV